MDRSIACASLILFAAIAGCAPPGAVEAQDEAPDSEGAVQGELNGDTQVVFLNYGGARLSHTSSAADARKNLSPMVTGTEDFAPFTLSNEYDRGRTVAAVSDCVSQFFSDMNVSFVTTRPQSGSYTMMMIGAIYPHQIGVDDEGGPYGRAPVDCSNVDRNDIGFLMLQSDTVPDFYFMCRSIAHELGHTFGLHHTQGDNAIVNGRVDAMCESDACKDAAATGAAKWDFINKPMTTDVLACGLSYTQNSYAMLMNTLGVHAR